MPGTRRSGPDIGTVLAARNGDQQALDQLIGQSLPLVYNIVGRALNGHSDVDDVVQETLLRVIRGLSELRDPKAFRSWLVAIAVRRIRDRERHRATARHHSAALETAEHIPDPSLDFAGLTILQLGLTDQRREVAEATRWLDGDHQELLSLWWLEATGELERAELADALGLSGRHVAVRVQRMKEQMETARLVVRALNSAADCAGLYALTTNWDGAPSPLWRKRFARHVRGCAACGGFDEGLLPMDRLLGGLPLLPVPLGLGGGRLAAAAAQHATDQAVHTPPSAQHGTGSPQPSAPRPGHRATGRGGRHGASHAGHARHTKGLMSKLGRSPAVGMSAAAAVVVTVVGALVAAHLTAAPSTTPAAGAPAPVSAPATTPPVRSPTPSVSAAPSSSAPASPTPSMKPRKPTSSPTHKAPVAPPPVTVVSSARKGVGVWSFPGVSSALAQSGASWYYTWSTQHQGISTPAKGEFVPMIWGPASVTPSALAQAEAEGPYLLGFNEPDNGGQSNMSVDQALDLWPQLMKAGRILGSPAVAANGAVPGGWLDRFMAGAAAKHYRVDFITLHWYGGDFNTPAAVDQLKSYLKAVHDRYHKPIWLTEYALIDFSHGTRYASPQQEAAFVTASAGMLAGLPYLQRYAWFGLPAKDSGPSTGLFRSGPVATEAGRAFESAR